MALLIHVGSGYCDCNWESYPTRVVQSPAGPSETLQLQTIWSLDCAGSDDPIIGKVVSTAPGVGGRILLVDSQLSRVLVVTRDGRVERVVGRKGEGPGDLRGAFRAVQLLDGTIGVSGGAPALTLQMGSMGEVKTWLESDAVGPVWRVAGDPGSMPTSSVRELRHVGGQILAATHSMRMGTGGMIDVDELAVFDTATEVRRVVCRREVKRDPAAAPNESELFEPFAYGRCDIGLGGVVAYSPTRDEWAVVVEGADDSRAVWRKEAKSVERSQADIESVRESLGVDDLSGVAKSYPKLGRLRWRPSGVLWVEVPLGEAPPGILARFEEYSAEGEPLRVIDIAAPAGIDRGRLLLLESGQFVVLSGFEEGSGELAADEGPRVVLMNPSGT